MNMLVRRKPVVWLGGEIKTPPFSEKARHKAGELIGRLQVGQTIAMPHSRPMPAIGERCHELRLSDGRAEWRIVYRTEPSAVLILDVFQKTTRATPKRVIEACQWRLKVYEVQRKER
jgi:phage-related protein